jgi:hypothetical protein
MTSRQNDFESVCIFFACQNHKFASEHGLCNCLSQLHCLSQLSEPTAFVNARFTVSSYHFCQILISINDLILRRINVLHKTKNMRTNLYNIAKIDSPQHVCACNLGRPKTHSAISQLMLQHARTSNTNKTLNTPSSEGLQTCRPYNMTEAEELSDCLAAAAGNERFAFVANSKLMPGKHASVL